MSINVTLENDVRLCWPTPIFDRIWPNTEPMNQRLRDIILDKEKNDKGIAKSMRGGWHSSEDLVNWKYPEIAEFIDLIRQAVDEMTRITAGVAQDDYSGGATFQAWANVLRDGGYNKPHTHPGCTWSGVYYVEPGETEAGAGDDGWIEFFDPRSAVEMIPTPGNEFGRRVAVEPKAGRMLAFPAWLRHYVMPYHGGGERISIAFNVRMEEFARLN